MYALLFEIAFPKYSISTISSCIHNSPENQYNVTHYSYCSPYRAVFTNTIFLATSSPFANKDVIAHYIELYSHDNKNCTFIVCCCYCSLYRAVFTHKRKRTGTIQGSYCSLYRAVFTTVYIILSISNYHLFSYKSTYYY